MQQMAEQKPEHGAAAMQQIQQMLQQAQDELQKIQEEPTIEQVLHFLKDNRAKTFVLDIETDSTIMADENAEKQRRTEFVSVLGELLPQLSAHDRGRAEDAPILRRRAEVRHRAVPRRPRARRRRSTSWSSR